MRAIMPFPALQVSGSGYSRDPVGRQQLFALPDPVLRKQQREACPVTGRGVRENKPMKVPEEVSGTTQFRIERGANRRVRGKRR